MSQPHSIAGGWLGTYAYRGPQRQMPPVRFEAAWTEDGLDGRFTGTILDDGPGGEAVTTGRQSERQIAFTKMYAGKRKNFRLPVEYEGTLSEDGMRLTGTWRILTLTGVWDARRLWAAHAEQEDAADTVDAPQERVLVEAR